MTPTTISPAIQAAIDRARERIAATKAEAAAAKARQEADLAARTNSSVLNLPNLTKLGWRIDDSRDWNERQQDFIHANLAGKSVCYIGAAGTGKTSGLKGAINSLLENNMVEYFQPYEQTKWLKAGRPGIVCCSFTNTAVRQIAKHMSKEITCITLHKLLEFVPVSYEVVAEDGTIKKTMRFEPSRNRFNKLPRSLKIIYIDESSMVDTALVNLLIDALPDPSTVQFIIIGDLHQLPPVYGKAILGRKLLELPIIELTHVYRQALLSPIINLAHDMKDGKSIPVDPGIKVIDNGEHGKLTIHAWKAAISAEDACNLAANHMKASILNGLFDPFQDIILIPKNVAFGQLELNKNIADWLGRQRNAKVYEVVAGFATHYYAVGDKVLVNKREAIITAISRNRIYSGKRPMNADIYEIDRWGGAKKRTSASKMTLMEEFEADNIDTDVDAILQSLQDTHTIVDDRKAASSHLITVRFINGTDPTQWKVGDSKETDEDFEDTILETAAEVNEMLFGYAMTVHKSQGNEWRRVYFILHQSHAAMCSRELLYTGITRAREELYLIVEPDRGMKTGTLTKAAKSPRIKGNTLAEKLVWLKEKFDKEAAEAQEKKQQQLTEEEEA